MRRRFLVIHNPVAGTRHHRRLQQVLDLMRNRGCTVVVRDCASLTDNLTLADAAAHSNDFDAIVAAGGDGTIRGAASALRDSQTPLGIIPIGTGNVLAHEIGLSLHADAIAGCLIDGPIVTAHANYANDQPFLLMAGIGFDGRVIGRLDTALKRRIGKLAYVWPVLRAWIEGPDELRVRIDGSDHAASWVVVTSVSHYAGSFILAPDARLNDPNLQVVLFKARGRGALIGQIVDTARGRISGRGDILHLSANTIEITSSKAVPAQIDGEPFGVTPVKIQTGRSTLNLIVPAAFSSANRGTVKSGTQASPAMAFTPRAQKAN